MATEDGLVLINDFLHRACKHERLGKENVALRAHYASGWPVISSYCYALDSRCEILRRFSQRLCPRSKRFVDSVITFCSSYIVFLHSKTADARQIESISISLFILYDYNLSIRLLFPEYFLKINYFERNSSGDNNNRLTILTFLHMKCKYIKNLDFELLGNGCLAFLALNRPPILLLLFILLLLPFSSSYCYYLSFPSSFLCTIVRAIIFAWNRIFNSLNKLNEIKQGR